MASSNERRTGSGPNKNAQWRPLKGTSTKMPATTGMEEQDVSFGASNVIPRSGHISSFRSCPPGFSKSHIDASNLSGPYRSETTCFEQQPTTSSDSSFTNSIRNKIGNGSISNPKLHCTFVPYLPQDDAVAAGLGAHEGGIDAVETQEVADLLNEELGKLLRMKPREFWKTVTTDNSIQLSLDSYLQFRRRWFDMPVTKGARMVAGIIVGDKELSRHIFMVLYRLSSNRDPGSRATDSLSAKEHADVIREKKLLDVPKLLDICAIYGRDNPQLTRHLVNNAFRSQTLYNDDLAHIIPPLLDTISIMHRRSHSTLSAISSMENTDMIKVKKELFEVIAFLMDVVVTLDAFVEVYPYGARILICSGHHSISKGQLLSTLASIHDTMLPLLYRGFSKLGNCAGEGRNSNFKSGLQVQSQSHEEIVYDEQLQLKKLTAKLFKFAWHLLSICYLGEGWKQAHSEDDNNIINRGLADEDPQARGDALVQAVLDMASSFYREDGNQSFAEDQMITTGALIRKIESRYKFLEMVEKSQQNGVIVLDDAQNGCISAVALGKMQMPCLTQPSFSPSNYVQEEAIISQSKISHIKDLFPDYGSGFLTACLEAYDDNPEEVIQRILEDTLHPDLLSLDRTLETRPDRAAADLCSRQKGKEKMSDSPTLQKSIIDGPCDSDEGKGTIGQTVSSSTINADVHGIVERLASSSFASSSCSGESHSERPLKSPVQNPGRSPLGRYIRKERGEGNAVQLLDQRDEVNAMRAAAMASQYEDEYDDSFDDLGTHIADRGMEETENLVDFVTSRSRIAVANDWPHNKTSPAKYDVLIERPSKGSGWRSGAASDSRMQPQWETNQVNREKANGLSNTTNYLGMSRGTGRGRRKEVSKGQYYVKDGKNYSYKLAGAVAVSNVEAAEALKIKEQETIHGLRRGGNVPANVPDITGGESESGDHGSGKPGAGRGSSSVHTRGRDGLHGRGRGDQRKDYDKHHRKDQAMRKHFASIGGM